MFIQVVEWFLQDCVRTCTRASRKLMRYRMMPNVGFMIPIYTYFFHIYIFEGDKREQLRVLTCNIGCNSYSPLWPSLATFADENIAIDGSLKSSDQAKPRVPTLLNRPLSLCDKCRQVRRIINFVVAYFSPETSVKLSSSVKGPWSDTSHLCISLRVRSWSVKF